MSIETGIPVTSSLDVRVPFYRTLSWRAIFAGVVAGLAVHLLLTLLGIGIGAGILDPVTDENPIANFSTGAAVAWGVSALIALFIGGWVAGRFVPAGYKRSGCLHGFLVWSVATIVMFGVVGSTTGAAIGGAAKIAGEGVKLAGKPVAAAAGGAADVAKDALKQNSDSVSSFLDEAVQSRTDTSSPAKAVAAKREIGYALTKLFAPGNEANMQENRAALVKVIAEQTGISEADANAQVDRFVASYERLKADLKVAKEKAEQKAREAADRASKALAHAAIWTFVAFLLGAIVASVGGKCGSCSKRNEDDARVVL